MKRIVRGEAMGRVVDWSARQEPRAEDGPRLTEADLFAAYSVGIVRGARAPFAVTRERRPPKDER